MTTHAKRERVLLADQLEAAGPDAPTLCEGWTARDLAAHVVVRERQVEPVASLVVKPLAARAERLRGEFAARPYDELIQMIRSGPPKVSPFRLKQVDEAANTVEFFVHAEDVRRAAEGWQPRALDASFQDTLWRRLETTARLLGRPSPVGLVLRRPNGQTVVARKGVPVVTVTGDPAELLLFAWGRQGAARVELSGEEQAVAEATRARSGLG